MSNTTNNHEDLMNEIQKEIENLNSSQIMDKMKNLYKDVKELQSNREYNNSLLKDVIEANNLDQKTIDGIKQLTMENNTKIDQKINNIADQIDINSYFYDKTAAKEIIEGKKEINLHFFDDNNPKYKSEFEKQFNLFLENSKDGFLNGDIYNQKELISTMLKLPVQINREVVALLTELNEYYSQKVLEVTENKMDRDL